MSLFIKKSQLETRLLICCKFFIVQKLWIINKLQLSLVKIYNFKKKGNFFSFCLKVILFINSLYPKLRIKKIFTFHRLLYEFLKISVKNSSIINKIFKRSRLIKLINNVNFNKNLSKVYNSTNEISTKCCFLILCNQKKHKYHSKNS